MVIALFIAHKKRYNVLTVVLLTYLKPAQLHLVESSEAAATSVTLVAPPCYK